MKLKSFFLLSLLFLCQVANGVGAIGNPVPNGAFGVGSNNASAPVFGIAVGTGANAGKFVNTLTGSPVFLRGTNVSGMENGCIGCRPGIAAVTSAQWQSSVNGWVSWLSANEGSGAVPYGQTNVIRVPFNGCNWIGCTGLGPFGNESGHYTSAGTDSNGRPLWSGGVACGTGCPGPGTGVGHEVSGDPTLYRTQMITIINALVAAGYYPIIDLHWGVNTLVSTGQFIVPDGQPAMPGPEDGVIWASVASVFGYPNGTNPCRPCMFELYNEPFGTNNSNSGGNLSTEAAYLGSSVTTSQFQFPTSSTSPAGINGGYLMLNNFGGAGAQNILGGGAVVWAVGYQYLLNAIRAAPGSPTNLILVGSIFYSGLAETFAVGNSGPMVITDSLNNWAAIQHQYTKTIANTQNFLNIVAAGIPFVITEMGPLCSSGSSGSSPCVAPATTCPENTGIQAATYVCNSLMGMGSLTFDWNNFNSAANASTNFASQNPYESSNGDYPPNGSNFRPAPPPVRLRHGRPVWGVYLADTQFESEAY
jgi:hypothetical protein